MEDGSALSKAHETEGVNKPKEESEAEYRQLEGTLKPYREKKRKENTGYSASSDRVAAAGHSHQGASTQNATSWLCLISGL
ncbi:hypothetical protein L6164_006341 [Bauhinia variegata]|uniref:Uncharacterized protein n=1 Tax=Bauhinia variegata TaxID=167791 RepID=A0ACB9PZK1_BAUVA|nr:hypothetical protein L6164_006341 [Bauhinia variegata]